MTHEIYFSQLEAITSGKIIKQAQDQIIDFLCIDSRNVYIQPGSLFIAIKGFNYDAHKFLKEAHNKGIRQFVIEYLPDDDNLSESNVIKVKNTVEAFQKLASYHRNQFSLILIAIAGSNAKTIVKEWLYQIIALQTQVIKNPKSYNSQVGVPLSVWKIDKTHKYGIFEAGLSMPGEMERLQQVLKPIQGVFTNIGEAHSQNFLNIHQKITEKIKLFRNCKTIFYCLDHEQINEAIQEEYSNKAELINWSFHNDKAYFRIQTEYDFTLKHTRVTLIHANQKNIFTVNFNDRASLENAIHCIVVLLYNNFAADVIQEGLQNIRNIPMRFEIKQGVHNCQIIDDTYNNDLFGLSAALDFMHQQKVYGKNTAIISDMHETGIPSDQLYSKIAMLLNNKGINRIIGIGKDITEHKKFFYELEGNFYTTTQHFLTDNNVHFNNELILIKGARKLELEKVTHLLEQKTHHTTLQVDLDVVSNNFNYFRNILISPATKIMAMVKAQAYGSSSYNEIPHLLQRHHVNYLAVAYIDEAISLRNSGINVPIMVMHPTATTFNQIIQYNLDVEIFSNKLLNELEHFVYDVGTPVNIHLKVETGMNRLGILESELHKTIQILKNCPYMKVVGVMSHLAASSEELHDEFSHQQASSFIRMAKLIEKELSINTLKHLLNSAGIVRFPEYQYDMVRLGIGLYGVGLPDYITKHLQVANTLKTTISQIKNISKGSTVGYSRCGLAINDMTIATIAIGYADGYSTTLGNGNFYVYINGHLANTIGKICMDMTMIDITGIPAIAGDEVVIFGKDLPIEQIALACNTTPYEILARIGDRVKKIYYTS